MNNNISRLLFYVLLFSFFTRTITSQKCDDQTCGNSSYSYNKIRSPFRIIDRQSKSCGVAGFDVRCNRSGQPLLDLPNSILFNIQSIDYDRQKIELSDQSGCLASTLLSFNLSNLTPFYAMYYQELAIFNCSGFYKSVTFENIIDSDLQKIDCLSGLNYTVYGINSIWAINILSQKCQWIANISFPDSYGLSFPLIDVNSFTMYWDEPKCAQCENLYRRCNVKGGSSSDFECTELFYDLKAVKGENGNIGIVIGITVPLLVLGLACMITWMKYGRQRNGSTRQSTTITTRLHNTDHTTTGGIDQSTLQSYPVVVVGSSGRLLKPDDNTCSICLSEYQISQELKILPRCLHRFHVACVDEWLLQHTTCPICREPPA